MTTSSVQVSCYYFPNYHADARNEARYGVGWNEWALLRAAQPRFEGHRQPIEPAWGYTDEADPAVFARKIDAAADHGVDAFIFDWYAYNDGKFLHRALEDGFMRASNSHRLKFALMWANHDWIEIFPAVHGRAPQVLHPGDVTRDTFERITDDIVASYFKHPSYWLLNGRPYFSIYESFRLISGLGGVAETRSALESFRRKTRAAGFPDLHLNAVMWGIQLLPGETTLSNPEEMVSALGIDSVTSYAWIHHVPFPNFPATDFSAVMAPSIAMWDQLAARFRVPYAPNVSMGWDPTPRCDSKHWQLGTYPFTPVLINNTPAHFRTALQAAKDYLLRQPVEHRVLTINAWNEWTEGSYLEPDTVHGLAYLEAIRDVF